MTMIALDGENDDDVVGDLGAVAGVSVGVGIVGDGGAHSVGVAIIFNAVVVAAAASLSLLLSLSALVVVARPLSLSCIASMVVSVQKTMKIFGMWRSVVGKLVVVGR